MLTHTSNTSIYCYMIDNIHFFSIIIIIIIVLDFINTPTIGGTSRATFGIPSKWLNIKYIQFYITDGFWIVTAGTILKTIWMQVFLKPSLAQNRIYNYLAGLSNVALLVPPTVYSIIK